jgi:hypothetical protein
MPERIGSPPHKVAKKIDQNSHALFEVLVLENA